MKSTIQVDIPFEQIISVIQKLPKKQKLKISEALEKDIIESKLSHLLSIFKTDEIDEEVISEEVERARKSIYEKENQSNI